MGSLWRGFSGGKLWGTDIIGLIEKIGGRRKNNLYSMKGDSRVFTPGSHHHEGKRKEDNGAGIDKAEEYQTYRGHGQRSTQDCVTSSRWERRQKCSCKT